MLHLTIVGHLEHRRATNAGMRPSVRIRVYTQREQGRQQHPAQQSVPLVPSVAIRKTSPSLALHTLKSFHVLSPCSPVVEQLLSDRSKNQVRIATRSQELRGTAAKNSTSRAMQVGYNTYGIAVRRAA